MLNKFKFYLFRAYAYLSKQEMLFQYKPTKELLEYNLKANKILSKYKHKDFTGYTFYDPRHTLDYMPSVKEIYMWVPYFISKKYMLQVSKNLAEKAVGKDYIPIKTAEKLQTDYKQSLRKNIIDSINETKTLH